MIAPSNRDPRIEQAAASDESLLAAHEKLLGKQPDEKAHYGLMPLALLFAFSGLIFWGGTYLNRYSGHFDAKIFDENAKPHSGADEVVKADLPALGKKQYAAVCITCHQANGKGLPGTYPPLDGSEWVNGSEDRVIRIVLRGLQGHVTVMGSDYSTAVMPSFGQVKDSGYNWSDEKVAAVLTYVRQEWSNKSGPIAPEKVAEIREKESAMKATSQEELMKMP
jgi:mono/diheme cytochrome c family protein